MTLPEMLARIVELAQVGVKCRCCNDGQVYNPEVDNFFPAISYPCSTCGGTGKVPDPCYTTLVEALTVECIHPKGCRGKCSLCGVEGETSDRVLRSWKGQPQGALNGALLQWASCLWKDFIPASEDLWKKSILAMRELSLLVVSLGQCFGRSDCDDRATERVLEYMEKAKEATHATE